MTALVFLTPSEASAYVKERHGMKVGVGQLANLRSRGGGPTFRKQGNGLVQYTPEWLDEYAAERMSKPVRSTSELAAA